MTKRALVALLGAGALATLPGSALAQPAPNEQPASSVPAPRANDAPRSPEAVERRVWRGEPLRVALPIDTERTVRFPGAASLRAGLVGGPVPGLRVQSLGDRLFVLATAAFDSTRLLVQTDSQASYLLDLVAPGEGAVSAAPVAIHAAVDDTADSAPAASDSGSPEGSSPPGYVALVRHAARSLYAPQRLMPSSTRIARVPLRAESAPALLRGGRVAARALVSWRDEGVRGPLWVTGVRLRNTTADPLELDPRDLRGEWLTATFQHAHLAAAGREADTTTVYLVSATPFDEALGAFFRPAGAGEPAP